MNKSKASIVVSQIIEKVEKIVGFCCAALFGYLALYAMFDDQKELIEEIIMVWVFCVIGIMIFRAGRKRTKMRLEFKKYVTQLSVDPSGSLENLASATGTSVDTVKKNLKYMIKKKFFTNAFINEQANQLVLPAMAQKVQQQAQTSGNTVSGTIQSENTASNTIQPENTASDTARPENEVSNTIQPEFVVRICPCCGGRSRIVKGEIGECDFCGSPLSE